MQASNPNIPTRRQYTAQQAQLKKRGLECLKVGATMVATGLAGALLCGLVGIAGPDSGDPHDEAAYLSDYVDVAEVCLAFSGIGLATLGISAEAAAEATIRKRRYEQAIDASLTGQLLHDAIASVQLASPINRGNQA
jgi:hypothetical protein